MQLKYFYASINSKSFHINLENYTDVFFSLDNAICYFRSKFEIQIIINLKILRLSYINNN